MITTTSPKKAYNNTSARPDMNSDTLSSPIKRKEKKIENVLILQGGGSLGAFGCGVFKAIANNSIKLDIVAGTSIGGVNAAIIVGSKDEKHPEQALERFWLDLSEGFVDWDRTANNCYDYLFELFRSSSAYHYKRDSSGDLSNHEKEHYSSATVNENEYAIKMKQLRSFYSWAIFGNERMSKPRWRPEAVYTDPDYFTPQKWTYIYDQSPLVKTLDEYIDYNKLNPNGNPNSRLILTAVNILTAEPLVFDSYRQQITSKHILAACAYPLYNFPWVEVEDGTYAWDGGLLSNSPLREVIDASPVNDKRVYIVENYPKRVDTLPKNLPEIHHRARDIIFTEKTEYNITMSKVITRYLSYIEELYQLIENSIDLTNVDQKRLKKIRRKYKRLKLERGAEIKEIFHITRDEPFSHIYEDADFSPEAIKNLIREGEMKAIHALKEGQN